MGSDVGLWIVLTILALVFVLLVALSIPRRSKKSSFGWRELMEAMMEEEPKPRRRARKHKKTAPARKPSFWKAH